MNVTNNGYYTSDYLNEVVRKRPAKPVIVAEPISPDSVPRSFSGSSPYSYSGSSPMLSIPGRSPTSSRMSEVDMVSTDEISMDDPDRLAQGITPAQLYYLQRRPDREDPRQRERQKQKYSDYYIQQKRRHDESDYKPKLYTHKTFRDVFKDIEEPTEKYNPMEFVFDDPELVREREQNQKVKRAFKTVLKFMGKDYYDDYDYYQAEPTKDKKSPQKPVNEVYVANFSDSSDNEEDEVEFPENNLKTKVYVNAAEVQHLKKNKKFSKIWKRRLKKAKKEIRKDYENNINQQRDPLNQLHRDQLIKELTKDQAETIVPEEEEMVESKSVVPVAQEPPKFSAGQNENFHPLWNYVLSWLAYEPAVPLVPAPVEPSNVPATSVAPLVKVASEKSLVPKTLKALKPVRLKNMNMMPALVNMKQNYKQLASKWNQPVRQKKITDIDSFNTAPPQPRSDGISDEFVVEVDSDYDESTITTELYYNPVTKQLEHEPPTSASALSLGAAALTKFFLFSPPENTLVAAPTDSSPVQIVSNINSLLKHIKLLRMIFAPIDIIAENFPSLQTFVILIELAIFMWLLYELSLLIDALCMMVKAVCAPMIAMGRFMNRIM